MKTNQALKVRTDMQAGRHGFPDANPGYYPSQSGWWWVPGGYIARPGRPLKAFAGWYYGPAPSFYYPGGYGGGAGAGDMLGAPGGGGGEPGDGSMAPPAP
jgi:hypothetical protein